MKKLTTPQVQVKYPGSYNAFYSVFLNSIDTIVLGNICYAMEAIEIKHTYALSE